jgi:hypothetical protein
LNEGRFFITDFSTSLHSARNGVVKKLKKGSSTLLRFIPMTRRFVVLPKEESCHERSLTSLHSVQKDMAVCHPAVGRILISLFLKLILHFGGFQHKVMQIDVFYERL